MQAAQVKRLLPPPDPHLRELRKLWQRRQAAKLDRHRWQVAVALVQARMLAGGLEGYLTCGGATLSTGQALRRLSCSVRALASTGSHPAEFERLRAAVAELRARAAAEAAIESPGEGASNPWSPSPPNRSVIRTCAPSKLRVKTPTHRERPAGGGKPGNE